MAGCGIHGPSDEIVCRGNIECVELKQATDMRTPALYVVLWGHLMSACIAAILSGVDPSP